MQSEHNLSIEQLQLIKLIENINHKYRQRCNIDKNKVLSDTNLKMLKAILPGLIILYKWNQEKKESSINLEELIDQQLVKYRRLQNVLNKKINKTPSDKSNLLKKDKNLIQLEYLAKIIKFISQEKTIQRKIRDLKVSEKDCMAILNKLNKLSYKIQKTCSKEKLPTSKYVSAILYRCKSLEKSSINYLQDFDMQNVTYSKSQLNTINENNQIIKEKKSTIIANTLHTVQNIYEEEQEQAICDFKIRITNEERYSLKKNNSETLLMYENKDKILNDSSDESSDLCSSNVDNNQSIYSSSIFQSCNENDDTSNNYLKYTDKDYTKIQKRKQLINDYSYILSIQNDNKTNGSIETTNRSQNECNCSECQEGDWIRLRGGKTKDNKACFCPQCLCDDCVGKEEKQRSEACNCGASCKCDPCGNTNEIDEILKQRITNTKTKCLKDTQPIYPPCSCPKDQCPCSPCNDPRRKKQECKCDCVPNECKCNPCKCKPCNDPACNLKKDTDLKKKSICNDTTCENISPKPPAPKSANVCACPNCNCNLCADPQCKKSKLYDETSIASKCGCKANACTCDPCKCDPCNDPACDMKKIKCSCPPGDACKCKPCQDPTRSKPNKCFCPEDSCPCDPCTDPTRAKVNKCFCPENSCPCEVCADPTRTKPDKCFCPENACACEKCEDPTRAKPNKCYCPENACPCKKCSDTTRLQKKCTCPEDSCQCNSCSDPERIKQPKQHECSCPMGGCPCQACGDPTRIKAKKCNCPENACLCENCTDPAIKNKVINTKKCNCPEDSCQCELCTDPERIQKFQARSAYSEKSKQNKECYCPKEGCTCEKCEDPTRAKTEKCSCPKDYCPCEKCTDPTRIKPKVCTCPENRCPCEECQDPTRIKSIKCTCSETYCPCETCEDPQRDAKNQQERSQKKEDICGCPEESCPCDSCADPKHVKPKKCSCPENSCLCENCGDPDRAKKVCVCPENACKCEDCADLTRKKEKKCSCPEEYCPCEKCDDEERTAQNKLNYACSCPEDACLCAPCSDPSRSKRNTCSCPKNSCSCTNCADPTRRKKPDECTCPLNSCLCDPCKDPTRNKPKCRCNDNACTCNECFDPTAKKVVKCSCTGECTCNPCDDLAVQAKKSRNDVKKCDCIGECNCNSCQDPTKKKVCDCESCICDACADSRFAKKKFCTCQPKCECRYCSLPKKTLVHSVTSLYKSAVSIVCDRLSAYVNKPENEPCKANPVQSQQINYKEVSVIYQQNKHPACKCDKCTCDPCCPTITESPKPPPPTEMLCVCDVQSLISQKQRSTMTNEGLCEKVLPIDCDCDKCICDPCNPTPKEFVNDGTCTCIPPCACCGTCNKMSQVSSRIPVPSQYSAPTSYTASKPYTTPTSYTAPVKNEICPIKECTCVGQCCCDPCEPKRKDMSKCKCTGTCNCDACAKVKKRLPENCTCDFCTCNPCQPKVKDETKCVCGQDNCDCNACLDFLKNQQQSQFKSRSSNKAPSNLNTDYCNCQPFCACDKYQNERQIPHDTKISCDNKIPCECYQCKCQKWENSVGKHEFCCICDDKINKCEFKCTCGEHCPCETQITIPVKDTLVTSDCTCNPCTCDPCFTKESQINKILSKQRTETSNKNNSLPCSCEPICCCGDCFNENVTQVHSYSDKQKKPVADNYDSANNMMIIKADEIQINEICDCCKCPDKNNKARDQQHQTKTAAIMKCENNKKRCETHQENEKKIEKQEQEIEEKQKKRLVAVIKNVCEKTPQNIEKLRVVAVINSSCQKNQQKIEIQEEQQRVVAVINRKCHKPNEKQLQSIPKTTYSCRRIICDKPQSQIAKVINPILNPKIQHQIESNPCEKEQIHTSRKKQINPCQKKQIDPDHKNQIVSDRKNQIDPCRKKQIDPCRKKTIDPCRKKTIDPYRKEEKVDTCRKEEKVNPSEEKTIPLCLENPPPCQKEQIKEPCQEQKKVPHQIVHEKESLSKCERDGYSSLKIDVCSKLKSKLDCIKSYFGDYFSELIKNRNKENDENDEDECTCDICKCRREIRVKRHNSTTEDCACSSKCKEVACTKASNHSKKQPCKTTPKSEQCLAIINSKKTLSNCASKKTVRYSNVDINTGTRGLGASNLNDREEDIENILKSFNSREENLIWSKTSSKDENASFIELYDYKHNNNKGLQAMICDDDDYDNDMILETCSPTYQLERKNNQQLRINDNDDGTSKSADLLKKYTHQQIYCVDIKNEKPNLKDKGIAMVNQSAYLFKNVKSLHSSITDLDDSEWNQKHNTTLNKKIIGRNNLVTTNKYKFCKKNSIDTLELLHFKNESNFSTAIKSINSTPQNDEFNWYFINMQGVVPISDNMDYKYKYLKQYGQPIMVTLSGQLSGKLSESINNSHTTNIDLENNEYERFVSDSKRVGINIPFISKLNRNTKESHSKDLKWSDSSHIPQREREYFRKTSQNKKSKQIEQSQLHISINNEVKSVRGVNTSNRRDLKSKERNTKTVNQLHYIPDGFIRKRGGAISKDNTEDSRKIESNFHDSQHDKRMNLNDIQQDKNIFRHQLALKGLIKNKEDKTLPRGNQSDLIPELKKSSDSICASENHDERIKTEESSCYGSSLSFNNPIYNHDNVMDKDYQTNNDEKIIDELYLNNARNNSSKMIDTKNDLTETVSHDVHQISFCSAVTNIPRRSISLGRISISHNSSEYNRSENNYHFARGGGYNPDIDNKVFNIDDHSEILHAYSGILQKTTKDIPETGGLSENKYYSSTNFNDYVSAKTTRKLSSIYIDDYILTNRATGLNATMSNTEISDFDEYVDTLDSIDTGVIDYEERKCAAKKFFDNQQKSEEERENNPDKTQNNEKISEQLLSKHLEECTCTICVCGDCNCKICECEKGVKEKYESLKKENDIAEEKARYCKCYICECNECSCIKCECDIDKFPEGIPLSKVTCPCTNCNCGIPCQDGTLLKPSKFFMNRDNDLFTIPDNLSQDVKVKILNAVQNVNFDIKFAIKNANIKVAEAMDVADQMVQDAVRQMCKMDIEAVTTDNTSFTEAKGAIDDSEENKNNEKSSNNPPSDQSNSNEKKGAQTGKGNCDCEYPCKCEDCPDKPHEPPACDCPEPCECVGCPTLNIPVKQPHCRCKTCVCDPCVDKKRKKGSPIEKLICGCKPECLCEKCPAKPGCECEGECVCPVCPHKERRCECAICLCQDCEAFKQVKELCECPQCLCTVCEKGGGAIPTKPPKIVYNIKCKCAVCLCDDCTSSKIQTTCSCPVCLCDKCPEMEEGKPSFECTCLPQCTCDKCSDPNVKCISKRQKEEPYKCTCATCYCEKCSDPTRERQDPCKDDHPKDCTCLKCTCSPCLSKKQTITECKCEKCKCNPCQMKGGMLKGCKCSTCECMECLYKTANIDECTCEICECNKKILCGATEVSGDQMAKLAITECTCDPCNCNPCLASNGLTPKCKCPKCMCVKCDIKPLPIVAESETPPDCKCKVCYCAPCKYHTDPNCDQTFRVTCTCEVCSCRPCKAKGDNCDENDKQVFAPRYCHCITCNCFPCVLPRDKKRPQNVDKLPTCLCGNCTCNPCMASPLNICNESREPPKFTLDCSCPTCYCNECAGKEPVNPCDLMKLDTTVVCNCTPKCNCDPCKLPQGTDPCQKEHPDTCKCPVCACKQCDLPTINVQLLQSMITDHADDCQCDTCKCTPCKLKPDYESRTIRDDGINEGPKCKCKICCCNPCKLESRKECTNSYSNLTSCVCTTCNCDPCKAKPKDCQTCQECFGKGDCKCLHCMCVPCTKTRPEYCNCQQCQCTNCLSLSPANAIPNCNCLHCLCKQSIVKDTATDNSSICKVVEEKAKKCPELCSLNEINKKAGRKKCQCSICYCNPCQPEITDTRMEYTFKPSENNPLRETSPETEKKKCTCKPTCLCMTCPKKMDTTKCICKICKCENCLSKPSNGEKEMCKCSRPCPCISCKAKGGAGSGNITTENINHIRGGAANSNSEVQSTNETSSNPKCSCGNPCLCQSCTEPKSNIRKYEDKPPCACATTPCVSTCLQNREPAKTNDRSIIQKLATQISSLVTKPFTSASNRPSTVSTAINTILNCNCPIPCLCASQDQCGTYAFLNTPEKDTSASTKITDKSGNNKAEIHSNAIQIKKRCNCVGVCDCSTQQIDNHQKQTLRTIKSLHNKNSPIDTRSSNQNNSSKDQAKRICDCVGLCKCINEQQFGNNQKSEILSANITERINTNFKKLNDRNEYQTSAIISSKSQSTQFRIFETRKLTEDSLLIKWTPANMQCLTGYEIDVNGSLSHRVRNKDRCVAVLFNICFDKPVDISVFAMSKEQRFQPPATINVCLSN